MCGRVTCREGKGGGCGARIRGGVVRDGSGARIRAGGAGMDPGKVARNMDPEGWCRGGEGREKKKQVRDNIVWVRGGMIQFRIKKVKKNLVVCKIFYLSYMFEHLNL